MFNDTRYLSRPDDLLHREDRIRQRACCNVEHEVLSVLHGADDSRVSPLALRFVNLLRAQPLADGGANVADVLITLNCGSARGAYWWTPNSDQHHAWLDSPRPH
jgi:hypothetical protein